METTAEGLRGRLREARRRWRRFQRQRRKFGLGLWLRRFFYVGTDGRRRAWALWLRARHPQRTLRRVRAARALVPSRRVAIDPELGFLQLPPGSFAEAEEIVAEVRRWEAEGRLDDLRYDRKPHLKSGLLDARALTLESPFLRLALHPEVVAAVSAYLGAVPTLSMLDVWRSRHLAGEPTSSQRWHCDWESEHNLRVMIYCSDVTPDHGPLVAIPAGRSRELRRRIGYLYGGKEARVTDVDLDRHLRPDDARSFPGPAGTLLFVDTNACFHFGSRIARPDLVRTLAVMTFFPAHAFDHEREYDTISLAHLARPEMDVATRLVLGEDA